jgi:hypothetical protein
VVVPNTGTFIGKLRQNRPARQGRKRYRTHKLMGRLGHNHLNLSTCQRKLPQKQNALIRSYPSANAKYNFGTMQHLVRSIF